jgi:hypothetical protein
MEIVQGNVNAIKIVNSNDEAKSYLRVPAEYKEVEYIKLT